MVEPGAIEILAAQPEAADHAGLVETGAAIKSILNRSDRFSPRSSIADIGRGCVQRHGSDMPRHGLRGLGRGPRDQPANPTAASRYCTPEPAHLLPPSLPVPSPCMRNWPQAKHTAKFHETRSDHLRHPLCQRRQASGQSGGLDAARRHLRPLLPRARAMTRWRSAPPTSMARRSNWRRWRRACRSPTIAPNGMQVQQRSGRHASACPGTISDARPRRRTAN